MAQKASAADTAPGGAPERFMAQHPPPPEFGDWKARTLLTLAGLAAGPGTALRLQVAGTLGAASAAWLARYCDECLNRGLPEDAPDAVLAVVACAANEIDDPALQGLLASCATPAGPQALFIIDTQACRAGDTVRSFAGTARMLAGAGYICLHDGYFAAWLRAHGPEQTQHAAAEAACIPAALQQRMLFIIGHARSGTSALFELLNYHNEVLLLFESNSFLPRMRRGFAENFSARMRAGRPALRKGFFFAAPVQGADHPFIVLPALLEQYRLVGEKIALAPRASRFEACAVGACFGYYAAHFPFARYIFLTRAPFEAAEALRRILPDADLAEILRLYASYMADMLQHQSILPASRVMFMEDFENLNSAALNGLAGFDLLTDGVTLSADKRTTRQAAPAPSFQALDYEIRSLQDLYRRTRAMFTTNGYIMRRDLQWTDFEAVVAAWRKAAEELGERAFE